MSGPGTFTFDSVSKFRAIGSDNTTRIETANARPVSVTVTDTCKREPKLVKQNLLVDCEDPDHHNFIALSFEEAMDMANAAIWYIKNKGGNDEIYVACFESRSTDEVLSDFIKVANSNTVSMVLSCSDPAQTCHYNDKHAYEMNHDIFFCDSFYSLFPTTPFCPKKSPINALEIRAFTTLRYLVVALLGDDVDKPFVNYAVSTQTIRPIPRAHGLTWVHDLCSCSLAWS